MQEEAKPNGNGAAEGRNEKSANGSAGDAAQGNGGSSAESAAAKPGADGGEALRKLSDSLDEAVASMGDGDGGGSKSLFEEIESRWQSLASAFGFNSRAELEERAKTCQDQYLRALAEAENVRKIAERDKRAMAKFGAAGIARDLLPVRDGLRRALDAVSEEDRDRSAALVEGIELTLREFTNALSRNGIESVAPEPGDQFDPKFHEAIVNAPSKDVAAGKILFVEQEGFMMHDRLLRPAKVIVSIGDPAAVAVAVETVSASTTKGSPAEQEQDGGDPGPEEESS